MMSTLTTACRRVVLASLLACAACALHAQQTPITGQMLAPVAPSPAAPVAATPMASPTVAPAAAMETTDAPTGVGDVTRQLLSLQAQGTQAGKHLPIPGQEASASYQRYLKSFEHPIPQFFDATVSTSQNGSSGSSGTSGAP